MDDLTTAQLLLLLTSRKHRKMHCENGSYHSFTDDADESIQERAADVLARRIEDPAYRAMIEQEYRRIHGDTTESEQGT